jgi:hypothetical protein
MEVVDDRLKIEGWGGYNFKNTFKTKLNPCMVG